MIWGRGNVVISGIDSSVARVTICQLSLQTVDSGTSAIQEWSKSILNTPGLFFFFKKFPLLIFIFKFIDLCSLWEKCIPSHKGKVKLTTAHTPSTLTSYIHFPILIMYVPVLPVHRQVHRESRGERAEVSDPLQLVIINCLMWALEPKRWSSGRGLSHLTEPSLQSLLLLFLILYRFLLFKYMDLHMWK